MKTEAQVVSSQIIQFLMDNDIEVEKALPGMSMALIAACAQMGIPREMLKDRLVADVDIIYNRVKEIQQ